MSAYQDRCLEIEVRDTGRRTAPDQVERIFQASVQADESTTRKYGGTGLGLVLTKRLASAMGATFFSSAARLESAVSLT